MSAKRDLDAVREAHRVTVTHVKTRNQWEGNCSCDGFSCLSPGGPTNIDAEATVRSNMRLHLRRKGLL
jgi:hypothetical protein